MPSAMNERERERERNREREPPLWGAMNCKLPLKIAFCEVKEQVYAAVECSISQVLIA
jgi:hypothetical protein